MSLSADRVRLKTSEERRFTVINHIILLMFEIAPTGSSSADPVRPGDEHFHWDESRPDGSDCRGSCFGLAEEVCLAARVRRADDAADLQAVNDQGTVNGAASSMPPVASSESLKPKSPAPASNRLSRSARAFASRSSKRPPACAGNGGARRNAADICAALRCRSRPPISAATVR
jgi:hypothetical protein